MKISTLVRCVGVAMVGAAVAPSRARLVAAEAEAPAAPASAPLHFAEAKRASAGIVVAPVELVKLSPEADAFGRVLDPTPYAGLVAEVAVAEAAAKASGQELARVRRLFAAGGNASAQAVETAEAAAARDAATLASARIRLLAGWGPKLAEKPDLAELQTLLESGVSFVRIDLLPGTELSDAPTQVNVALLGDRETSKAEVMGPAPIADPEVQGRSYLALVRGHTLPAGATLQVRVPTGGPERSALAVPRAAVVYHEGSAWAYVLQGDDFSRRRVELGRSINESVVVTSGLSAQDRVAVAGAQQLLSSELTAGTEVDER